MTRKSGDAALPLKERSKLTEPVIYSGLIAPLYRCPLSVRARLHFHSSASAEGHHPCGSTLPPSAAAQSLATMRFFGRGKKPVNGAAGSPETKVAALASPLPMDCKCQVSLRGNVAVVDLEAEVREELSSSLLGLGSLKVHGTSRPLTQPTTGDRGGE